MKVAILGATGMVGQRFIEMLEGHPFFDLTDLAASSRSAGKNYKDAAKWYLDGEMPEDLKDRVVKEIDPSCNAVSDDADAVVIALMGGYYFGVFDQSGLDERRKEVIQRILCPEKKKKKKVKRGKVIRLPL